MESNKPAITRREVNIFREILRFLNDTSYTLLIQSDGDLMRRFYSMDTHQIKSAIRHNRYMIVLDENNKVVRRYNFY